MMPPKFSSKRLIVAAVSIVLALVAWTLPELPFISKLLIGIVLLSTVLISFAYPGFIGSHLSHLRAAFLWIVPIGVGILECIFMGFAYFGENMFRNASIGDYSVAGFAYGIFYGLPLSLLGAYQKKRGIERNAAAAAVRFSGVGCVIQAVVIIPALNGVFIGLSGSRFTTTSWGIVSPAMIIVNSFGPTDTNFLHWAFLFALGTLIEAAQFFLFGYLIYNKRD